ncbi:phasin family protein [Oceanicella actignis]|uniref:phasin family protein n=1 Tax=Oceanicella actignis TaxID=1189325 RepID=UPI001255651E|nr:phasin family protein [Oceanicella actignis]TYO88826.1 phasin family protein [Oceanicella actignis]
MFDKFYTFEPEKFAELFKTADMTKFFEQAKMPMFDMTAVMDAQKKNMDALIAANKAVAAGYQDLFKKQVAIFEETMAAAQAQLSELKMDQLTPEASAKQAELVKTAFEKAVANMTELAEAAKKANMEAFEIVQARVKESIEEIKELAKTAQPAKPAKAAKTA